mgnify:FL=1
MEKTYTKNEIFEFYKKASSKVYRKSQFLQHTKEWYIDNIHEELANLIS